MSPPTFFERMKQENFMNPIGRQTTDDDPNTLPVPIPVDTAIPRYIEALKDDPWRSLAALVRKVKDKDKQVCPADQPECLRGYFRECQANGRMTAFFEFRWAYFMNEAYQRGCEKESSYWDDTSDCQRFERAYQTLLQNNQTKKGILEQDTKAWHHAAKLLVPLCRGKAAAAYTLPATLGAPMGGAKLPGYVAGKDTPILEKDPTCRAPECPPNPLPQGFFSGLFSTAKCQTNNYSKK